MLRDNLASLLLFRANQINLPEVLCAYNTVQFKDYSRYESSIFNPEEKFAYREEIFPKDCATAYEIGRDLILK